MKRIAKMIYCNGFIVNSVVDMLKLSWSTKLKEWWWSNLRILTITRTWLQWPYDNLKLKVYRSYFWEQELKISLWTKSQDYFGDYSEYYDTETELCRAEGRGLWIQFKRDATVRDTARKSRKSRKPREFWRTDLMNGKKNRDFYYMQLQNVRDGFMEEDPVELKKYYKCLTSAKV